MTPHFILYFKRLVTHPLKDIQNRLPIILLHKLETFFGLHTYKEVSSFVKQATTQKNTMLMSTF